MDEVNKALHLLRSRHLKTTDRRFPELSLQDAKQVAISLIESYEYKNERDSVAKPGDYPTIKDYLKAMVNLDRGPVEAFDNSIRADVVQRRFINEVIDNRNRLYAFYLEFKWDLIEATRAQTRTDSPSATTSVRSGGRERSLPDKVRSRDDHRCVVTGVYDSHYWYSRKNRNREDHPDALNVPCMPLEVAHIIPWNPGNNYWGLAERLTGLVIGDSPDVPQNAILVCQNIHDLLGMFFIYFDNQLQLCVRKETVSLKMHANARQSPATVGGLVGLPILQTGSPEVPGPAYKFFLLHRLIGDLDWMAGGAGLEELDVEDDDGPSTGVVSENTMPRLVRKLVKIEHLQHQQEASQSEIYAH